MTRRCFLILIVLLFGGLILQAGSQAETIRTFTLQHRSAEALLPLLRPLASEHVKLSGAGSRIFARGEAGELDAMAGLLREMDVSPQQFLIQVRQSKSRVQVPGNGRLLGNARHGTIQTLVLENGAQGAIMVGRNEPFTSEQLAFAGEVFGYGEVVEYQELATGFQVRVSLEGKGVSLELTPFMEELDPSASRKTVLFQQAQSVVRIPLGIWYDISRTMISGSEVGRVMLTRRADGRDAFWDLSVKVIQLKEAY